MKIKRIISSFLGIALVLGATGISVSAERVSGISYEISENFTNCILGEKWGIVDDEAAVSIEKDGSNDILKIVSGSQGVEYEFSSNLANNEYVDISFKTKLVQASGVGIRFVNPSKNDAVSVVFQPDKNILLESSKARGVNVYGTNKELMPSKIVADTWKNIRFRIDTASSTCNIWIDDDLVAKNILACSDDDVKAVRSFARSSKVQFLSEGSSNTSPSMGDVFIDEK